MKQYLISAKAFSSAFLLNSDKADEYRYYAGCAWALAGNSDSAFCQLMLIANANNNLLSDYDYLVKDTDLMNLHYDKRWIDLCKIVKINKEKIDAKLDKPLVAILDTVYEDDQNDRLKEKNFETEFGNGSDKLKDLWKTINSKDSINLGKVEKILEKYGWLGPDVIGVKGNVTLFLVIQHSDISTQRKYLPVMREAVKNKKADPADLALLEDRVALREGKKQIYGTQVMSDSTGSYWLSPLEDPDNVDKRRAEVGLPPISDYLRKWNIIWNIEDYKKQLPYIQRREKGE